MSAVLAGVILALAGIKASMELVRATGGPGAGIYDAFALDGAQQSEWTGSPEEIDILEAVFRYQFLHNPANETAFEEAAFVFLGVRGPSGEIDPPVGLLGRFADRPTIEPVSAADITMDGVEHKTKTGRSVLFLIQNLLRIDDSTFEVQVEYVGGFCTAEHLYRFERHEGAWVMVTGGMIGIS